MAVFLSFMLSEILVKYYNLIKLYSMYLSNDTLEALRGMEKTPMSIFKGREIKHFKSYDPHLTQQYHGHRDKNEPAVYELVMMNWVHGSPQYLIKYPYTDFFVELPGAGASVRGVHQRIVCKNPIGDWVSPYYYQGELDPKEVEILRFGSRVLLTVNKFDHDFLDEVQDTNVTELEYVKIPDFRTISYAFYSTKYGKYLIVDQSEFNFSYEGMRAHWGSSPEKMKEVKIENFARYRDGGTTLFSFTDDGETYEFFSPSPFDSSKQYTTLNETVLVKLDENHKKSYMKSLNLLTLKKSENEL